MVRRMQARDEAAARALFDRYADELRDRVHRRLPRALRRKIGDSDVIQETYLAAFRDLWQFEARGSDEAAFKRWLASILENRIRDEIRRFAAQKRDAKREVSIPSEPARSEPTPSVIMMAAEQRAAVWAAIDQLPADQQLVVRLVHAEDLTYEDAAARLDRSPEAVRKLYGRAIKRLSEMMLTGGSGDGAPPTS